MDHFQYPGYPPYYMQSPPYPYLMNPPPMPTVSSVQSSDGFGYVAKVRFGSGPAIKKSWVFFPGFLDFSNQNSRRVWVQVPFFRVGSGLGCQKVGFSRVWGFRVPITSNNFFTLISLSISKSITMAFPHLHT